MWSSFSRIFFFDIPKNNDPKPYDNVNLIYQQFDVFDSLYKTFKIITSTKKIYKFNTLMIKKTSSVINQYIENYPNAPDCQQFQFNIEDKKNIMGKIEQLYNGEEVIFSKNEFNDLKLIIKKLDLTCFPKFIEECTSDADNIEDFKLVIDMESLKFFISSFYSKNYKICTKKKEYHCNCVGIHSSGIYNNMIKAKDSNDFQYKYDFEDKDEEFQIVCNYLNFQTIEITPSNVRLLKKISKDLQIKSLLIAVDKYINLYENNIETIYDKKPIIKSINELLEYLYNRKNASLESTKEYLISSEWSQTEDNSQELVAYMIQVIHTNIKYHPFMLNLIDLLNKSSEENAKIVIKIFVQKLMDKIGYNNFNCAFIFKLMENGFITQNEIAERIYNIITVDFIYKKDKLSYYERFIKSNAEMFEAIDNERINNMLVWFFCELNEIKNISFEMICEMLNGQRKQFIQKYIPNDIEEFKKMRKSGEPDDEDTKALIHDNVEKIKLQSPKITFGMTKSKAQSIVPFNIFDSYVENGETTYLDYAAAYGSIECFKFLLTPPVSIGTKTLNYAVFGQNKEIIDIINQKKQNNNFQRKDTKIQLSFSSGWSSSSNTNIHKNELYSALIMHINDHFDWLLENKYYLNSYYNKSCDILLDAIFSNGNIHALVKLIEEGFNLYSLKPKEIAKYIIISAKSGFYRLTQLVFSLISKNDEYQNQVLKLINAADFYSYGSLLIIKLYNSLNIKNANYVRAIALSVIKNYLNNIKYSFESLIPGKIQMSSEKALVLIKLSIYMNNADIFKYLTKKLVGLDNFIKEFPSPFDHSILHLACDLGNFEMVKLIYELIDKKKIKYDCTDFFLAASSKGFNDICQFLIENKVLMNFSKLSHSEKELTFLNLKTFTLLYSNVDSEEKEKFGGNFLYSAINNHNIDIVSFLLEKKVSYDNALFESVSCNDVEITKLILQHDSSPSFINRVSKKGTALNIAVLSNDINIVKILLSVKGIDPSLYQRSSKSALINAFTNFNIDIINLMLEFYGNDIQSQVPELNESIRIILDTTFDKKIFCSLNMKATIIKLLEIPNIDLNYQASNYTLLTFACQTNQLEIVSKMISNENVDINLYESINGNTPLIIAIENKNIQISELLLTNPRINVNLRNFQMKTPLMLASDSNLTKIVELIIKNDKFDPVESRLDCSFMISRKEASLQLLSLKELDVNYQDEEYEYNNNTTLIHAISQKDIEKVDIIIHHHSFDPIKSQIRQAIFTAATNNSVDIFKKLLPLINNEINIHSQDDDTLLTVSCSSGSKDIILEIVNNPNFDSNKSKMVHAYQNLLNTSEYIFIDMLDYLYKYDENHNHVINFKKLLPDGKSFYTSINPKVKNINEVVTFLLNHGADPNYPDEFGIYPLQYAIENSSYDFVKTIMNSPKIDLNRRINIIDNENQLKMTTSYLHIAAKSPSTDILKEIIDMDFFDINIVDSRGNTPLIIAVKNKNYTNIKCLFDQKDLDYRHCNNEGDDALSIETKNSWGVNSETLIFKDKYLDRLLVSAPRNTSTSGWGSPKNSQWGKSPTGWGSPQRK